MAKEDPPAEDKVAYVRFINSLLDTFVSALKVKMHTL